MKIAVIGSANIDIIATPSARFVPYDSNPGRITFTLGGVGRNIAFDLSHLGEQVSFLTAFGGDEYASRILLSCRECGIDLSRALYFPDMSSSIYLCVNDEKGDLAAGVADTALCNKITSEYLFHNIDFLNSRDAVVFDTNLAEETMSLLIKKCTSPLFVDCISVRKAMKLIRALSSHPGKIYTLKANRYEAEALTGMTISSPDDAEKCTRALHDMGVLRVVITLGADGVFASDGKEKVFVPCRNAAVVNSNGAGDAFLAALVHANSLDLPLSDAVVLGQAAAKITLESEGAVSDMMSRENLYKLSGIGDRLL